MIKSKFFAALLLAVVFAVSVTSTAFAGKQDFTLINQTGKAIINLYIAPTKAYTWNDDILGVDILNDGDSVQITFDRSEPARYWDMMATFSDGNDWVWDSIDLFSVSQITLKVGGLAIEQ